MNVIKVILLTLFISLNAYATEEINAPEQLGLHGYDPVAYFNSGPRKGSEYTSTVYDKVKYLFSSVENQKAFVINPQRFLPEYGGYCAYGVRMGKKLDIDPMAFEINNNRLYVMLNRATHKIWQQDVAGNIRIANQIWPKIQSKSLESLK